MSVEWKGHISPSFEAQSVGTRRPLGEPQAGREWIRPAAAQHCLLFALEISGHPGQRLGWPDWGLTVSTPQFLPPWGDISSSQHSYTRQIGDRMVEDTGQRDPEVLLFL